MGQAINPLYKITFADSHSKTYRSLFPFTVEWSNLQLGCMIPRRGERKGGGVRLFAGGI